MAYDIEPTDSPSDAPGQDQGADPLIRDERLQAFGATLAGLRDKWIRARAATGWDKRYEQDLDQYHGRDAANKMAAHMMESVEQGYPVTANQAQPHRSTIFVGITRQKTNAAESRLCDILLPTDDRNWGIQPTPDPECAQAMKDKSTLVDPATGQTVLMDANGNVTSDPSQGQPVTRSQVAQAVQQYAKKCAEAMQLEIDDQLIKCDYNSEVRKAVHDSAVGGTGILKGPVVTMRISKAWREQTDASGATVQMLEVAKELAPMTVRVDPRMVWEDPTSGEDPKNGQGIFELSIKTMREVRNLAKQPGYLVEQLRKVLEEGPRRSAALTEARQTVEDKDPESDKSFQHWIYWGELDPEDLEAAGVALDQGARDILKSTCGCVEMINNTVVRAYLNPLEEHPIPYDFYPWEKVSGSARGYGIPRLMRAQQAVTNSAWRQLMDNAGVSSGPQIVIKQSTITPADGQWTLTPRKIWYANDDTADVRQAFSTFEFNSHQQELEAIIKLAESLADQETATPMLAQGQQGSAPDTVGGMQILMNSANTVLKRLVKQFDDYVTKPHVRRYYEFNMLYSDKEEIKGEFQIDARGSSALVVRDIQNQAVLGLLSAAANPVFGPMINARKLFEKALQAQHIDPKDILYSEAEVQQHAQQHPPQPDPRIMAAQISAQGRLQEAQAVSQGRAAETQARTEAAVADRNLRLQELMVMRDIEILKTASAEKISVDKIKAMLAQTAIEDHRTKALAAAELAGAAHNPQPV
jgi:hypothetical protein